MSDSQPIISIILNECGQLKCQKCNNFPDITMFNSENRVKIFSECKNKHFNISFLDEYIKNIISDNNALYQCQNCHKERKIKICQFCENYLCEDCNNDHLTIEHIINTIFHIVIQSLNLGL